MDIHNKRKVRIGDILLEKGLLTPEQLETALNEQKRTRKKLGKAIIDLGFISEVKLLRELSDFLGYPYVDLSRFRLDTQLIHQLITGRLSVRCRSSITMRSVGSAIPTRTPLGSSASR